MLPHFTRSLCALTATASLSLFGCDNTGGTEVPDGPPTPDAPPTPDGPPPTPDAPPTPGCPAGQLCLAPHPVASGLSIPDGRLVLAFYQFIDDYGVVPRIMYDVPFSPQSGPIQISLADVTLPTPADDYQLCIRTCQDLADPACDCPAAEAKVLTAFVFVAADTNGSGAIELDELDESNIYGIGYMHLGGGDRAYPAPNPLDIVFPEGIQEGLRPYRIIPGDPFDKLGIPAAGSVFELDLCEPGSDSCEALRFPNIT